jgi:hypothetical protein
MRLSGHRAHGAVEGLSQCISTGAGAAGSEFAPALVSRQVFQALDFGELTGGMAALKRWKPAC